MLFSVSFCGSKKRLAGTARHARKDTPVCRKGQMETFWEHFVAILRVSMVDLERGMFSMHRTQEMTYDNIRYPWYDL